MNGDILSHNHSNGTTFTAQDIYMLKKAQLIEFRASNQEGAYVIRQPLLWDEKFDTVASIDDVLYAYELKYAKNNRLKLVNKEISLAEYLVKCQQYSVEKFCKINNIEYFFEEREK